MRTYVVRRVLNGLLVLWLVSVVIFSLVRILPGDAVIMQLDQAAAPTPEILSRARQELGLERPFLAQYRTWITGAVQGDLGRSLITRRPVMNELLKRINLTSHLAVMSIIVAMLIALPRPAPHSGSHHRGAAGGGNDADDSLLAARGAAPGLHPHRARQGRARARGDRAARAE